MSDHAVGLVRVGDRDDPSGALGCLPLGPQVATDAHHGASCVSREQQLDNHVGGQPLADPAGIDLDAGPEADATDDGIERDGLDGVPVDRSRCHDHDAPDAGEAGVRPSAAPVLSSSKLRS